TTDPRYTPPEAADYESDDIRSDVYSLGCVLYRLLAGAPPFVGADDNETRQKQRAAPVPPVPGEPSGSAWNAVFAKLLAKRPEDRPQPEDIETLMRPLRYAGTPGPAPRPPTPRPTVAPTPPPAPPPTPPPDSVSPVAGRVGTTFHLVFVGLGGGDIYRTSYTRGNVTTQYTSGDVPSSGTVVL